MATAETANHSTGVKKNQHHHESTSMDGATTGCILLPVLMTTDRLLALLLHGDYDYRRSFSEAEWCVGLHSAMPNQNHPIVGVGTARILTDPRTTKAPDRINQPVHVPSVYEDGRGEIHNFRIGDKRINLLYTKAGVMRSGDIHKTSQRDFVFTGRVRVWTLDASDGGTTIKRTYGPNEYVEIPPYVPHVFEFVEDTVMAEWWDGPFEAWFYEPYRRIVQESLVLASATVARQHGRAGQFFHYVLQRQQEKLPQTDSHRPAVSGNGRETEAPSATAQAKADATVNGPGVWLTTGLILGLFVGYAVGTRGQRQ